MELCYNGTAGEVCPLSGNKVKGTRGSCFNCGVVLKEHFNWLNQANTSSKKTTDLGCQIGLQDRSTLGF